MTDARVPSTAEESTPLPFVDTHAHLDEAVFDDDRGEVVARAVACGVGRIINIAYRPARWQSSLALNLNATYPMIQLAVGLHPGHADEYTPATIERLHDVVRGANAVAIGEIGLDFFRPGYDVELQRQVFLVQLELAAELKLPVIIHQRAAEATCIEILRAAPIGVNVILHSFDGTWELGRLGIDRGHYFGVGGLMTRGGAGLVREILTAVPVDRLLLETDSPYLTPNGVKTRRNEPANIPLIAARLADLKNLDTPEIAKRTTANAFSVFNLRPHPEENPTDAITT